MTDLTITASAYQDPLFNQLRQKVAGCSDHYPVLMLPVRLETRFKKVTRYVNVINPNINRFNDLIDKLWKLICELHLVNRTPENQNALTLKQTLEKTLADFSELPGSLKNIKDIESSDRVVLRDSLDNLQSELKSKLFGKHGSLKKLLEDLAAVHTEMLAVTGAIPSPANSPHQPGWDALAELVKLENAMASIYGINNISTVHLDATLTAIDNSIQQFTEIVEKPDFFASEATIGNIQSKISYIKRQQKNSPVRLTDFKKTYAGTSDLVSQEYLLRNQINDLKARIDDDFVPYMQLLAKLKQYPVRQLTYRIRKCSALLNAANTAGFPTADALLNERESLYKQLRKIRESAQQPLQGSIGEISTLKAEYDKLDYELRKLMEWARQVKPLNRTHKIGLTRLRTHLTNEYLADLKKLMTGEKETESQVFSNQKVRHTATAFKSTLKSLQEATENISKINQTAEKAMLLACAKVAELDRSIRLTSTNTILLPRDIYNQTLSAFQSLSSQLGNFYTRNKVSQNHFLKPTIQSHLDSVYNNLTDQLTDVFNEKDRFYDEFRKRITFLVKSETISELWVRIYPDDIAIDNHDERLTEHELQVGKDYYHEVYSLPESERNDAKLPVWRAAATAIGPRRAAYVIRILQPEEIQPNTVATPRNPLPPLTNALALAYKVSREAWSNAHESTHSLIVRGLPGTLQNALVQRFFTPCSRTRGDLEALTLAIQDALKYYESNLEIGNGTFPNQVIVSEYKALKFAHEITLGYYKDQLQALHLPFDPQLTFPQVEMRSREWDRAGVTSVMPDRFVVVTKRGGEVQQIVVGKPISPNLQVGIDPETDEMEGFYHLPNGDLQIPEKLRWMFEFDAAVEAGMGIRVPIRDEDFKEGFSFVMAYGIRTHEDLDPTERPAAGQELLNNLLSNHMYSDGGLEYLPVGTATNNTDAVKSPYTTLDDDIDGLFKLFVMQQPGHGNLPYSDTNEIMISDGQFFRDALGIPQSIASMIRNHEKQDISQSRAMSRLLFGSTLGYYMRFMLRNLFNDNDLFQVIPFMMRHVSAVGTLPSFRIDKQPYGIMPITLHHKLWVDEPTTKGSFGSFIHKLSMFLAATRKVYEQEMVKKVHTINSPAYDADPQKVFLEILGLEPYSKQYLFREGANLGGRWGDLEDLEDTDIVEWSKEFAVNPSNVSAHYEYLLNKLGHNTPAVRMKAMLRTRCYGARYVNSNDILGHPVQHPDHGRGKLEKLSLGDGSRNYLEWLTMLSDNPLNLFNIPAETSIDQKCNTLLFELARIALMYDNGSFAQRSANIIAALDVPVIERLMAGHLDLCSYRIDAWQTGLADYRLRELRSSNPTGMFIGAYGFVENLRQAPPKEQVQHFPDGLEPDNGTRVDIMPDNQGYIHGPTLNHAVTAAVLRAGYNSQKKNATDSNNIFGINLSSSRIRMALHMLEGAAQGQETGALLGYLFERALHEKYKDQNGNPLEMDVQIYRLRRKFPTYSDKLFGEASANIQQESIRALNVVDGLELLDHMENFIQNSSDLDWDDDYSFVQMLIRQNGSSLEFPGYPYGLDDILPSINAATEGAAVVTLNKQKARAFIHELDHMADSLDAMGDLITAEGVYQLVRGNHTRANAVLSAMSEGRVPTDPEIIRNMREGNMISQRVMLAMMPGGGITAWSMIPASPRSAAEPALNQWIAGQLGDPAMVDWKVTYGNTTTYFTLADLAMQPIDLVILAGSGEEGLAELELRAAGVARHHGASANDDIAIDFYQSSPGAMVSLGEQLALIQQLGKIAVKARPADGRDFRLPEEDESFGMYAPSIDTGELLGRLQDAVNGYDTLLRNLAEFMPGMPITPQMITRGIERSIELTGWGFNGYYPNITGETDQNDLISRLITAREKMTRNLNQANTLLTNLPLEPEQVKWLDASHEIGELLFGAGFRIIPQITIDSGSDLKARMDAPHAGGILRNITEDGLESWFSDLAMVRKNLVPLDIVRMLTEVYQGRKIPFSVLQMPHIPNNNDSTDEYWLGAPYPESWHPEGDKLSLVIFGHQHLGSTTCALVFDEWTEIIPLPSQTSGIALHYNQPDARPPQTLMLAVSPDVTGSWSIDDLGLIVEEAFRMAQIRAVEPDHFDKTMLAQLLPATTLLSGGEEDVVRRMFAIYGNQPDEGLKGALADFSAVNSGVKKTEI